MSDPTSLLIFTTSQSPLPIRYPRPHKPNLILPPLIHRSLHLSLDASPPSTLISTISGEPTLVIPHPETIVKHDIPRPPLRLPTSTSTLTQWTNGEVDPNITSQPPELSSTEGDKSIEVDSIDEITVKIHLIASESPTTQVGWIKNALGILRDHKGLKEIDTLLIGFKGVDYKGKRSVASEFFGCGSEGLTSDVSPTEISQERKDGVKGVWEELIRFIKPSQSSNPQRPLQSNVDANRNGDANEDGGYKVKELGTLYLPLDILKDLGTSQVRPKVNSMDTPDCHSLPKEYSNYAKENNIELWAGGGGEGSDPIPDAELHNLLHEFHYSIPRSVAESSKITRLETQIPLREDGLKYEDNVERGVEVKWVLGYTLYSKTRNVLKDKGYIISANLTS